MTHLPTNSKWLIPIVPNADCCFVIQSTFQTYLTTTISKKFDKHENILLIVTFSDKQYHNLPLMEVLYRHHFKNILYCGEPVQFLLKNSSFMCPVSCHFSKYRIFHRWLILQTPMHSESLRFGHHQCDQTCRLLFDIWPFTTMKKLPNINFCQNRFKILPNTK